MKLWELAKKYRAPLGCLAFLALALLYPLHAIWSYALAALLLAACAALPVGTLTCLYVLLFCFDPVLPFPLLGGSIVRVMQGGMALRLGVTCLRGRLWPSKGEWVALGLCLLSFVLSLRSGIQGDSLSFIVNMVLFLLIRRVLRAEGEIGRWVPRFLLALGLSVCFAALWGLVYGRFLRVPVGGVNLYRFMGTYEPNFMAMFANVAWIGLICLPTLGNRWIDGLLLGLCLAVTLLTYSVTGYLVLGILALCLLIQKTGRKPLFFRILRSVALGLVLFLACTWAAPSLIALNQRPAPQTAEAAPADTAAEAPAEQAVAQELSPDPNDLVLLPEEYERARQSGEAPVAYRRPLSLLTPVARLRMEQAEALAGGGGGMGARVRDVLWCVEHGEYDLLTSGRLGLYTEKLKDFAALPWWQKLLGTGPAPRLTYMPLAYTLTYTHNSYLDMLDSFGILGFVVILGYILYLLRTRRMMGMELTGANARAMRYARIALLVEMVGLSMYLNRVVLFFFL